MTPAEIAGEAPWACAPRDIYTGGLVLIGTFGRLEAEAAAWLIVHLYKTKERPWDEVFYLPELLGSQDEEVARRLSNPFWRPDFHPLLAGGFLVEVVPGTPAKGVRVTRSFVERCAAGPSQLAHGNGKERAS